MQTLNACLLWAEGVLVVVAGMLDQCGSKSDARWPGEREKVTTTKKFRQVPTSSASSGRFRKVTQVLASSDSSNKFWQDAFFEEAGSTKVPASSASSGRFRQVQQVLAIPTSSASSGKSSKFHKFLQKMLFLRRLAQQKFRRKKMLFKRCFF